MKLTGLMLPVCLIFATAVCAQTSNPPDAPQAQPQHKGVFSKFSPPLSLANDARPMTAGDKFKLFAMNTVNPFNFVATAGWAGIEQAENTYPSWGQGGEGYGKRYAASFADTASGNFFGTFLFPSILRQDPRYFRKEHGGFGTRFGYAVSRIFVTRTDHGNTAPNASLWLGAAAAGGLANLYYPRDQQGVDLTFERAGTSIATTAGFNVAREFWPDVSRKLFHRHSR